MPKHNPNSSEYKRCSSGDNCIHPDGPYLPRTAEYYYINKAGKPIAKCRPCAKLARHEHHVKNRERDNAYSREYARANPERYKYYSNKTYIRKLSNGGSYTQAELDMVYKQQKGCCAYCGVFVGLIFDIDHRIPVSRGGSSDISNIVISCRACNDSKGDKLLDEWDIRPPKIA